MVDPILLVALALAGGSGVALAPLPAAAAAVGVAVVLRRRASRWALVAAALAILIGAARSRAALDAAAALHARAVDRLTPPARCEGEAVVRSSPVVQGGAARVDVDLVTGACAGITARLYGAPLDLGRGDRLELIADVAPVHLFLDEGQRDPRAAIARSGVAASGGAVDTKVLARGRSPEAWIDRARAHVRRRIEATFHREAAPLARALVLGETDLTAEDDEAFRTSGLAHLLAVSGTHLVIAVLGVVSALRAVLLRIERLAARWDAGRIAAAAAIPIAWLYADFAGGSGSAVRAAAMLSAAMAARAIGRRPSGARAFAWSILGAAALDPLALTDISFALSAAATAGLLTLQRPLSAALVRGPKPARKALEATAATLAAMIACAPLLAAISPTLPALGIVANVVAAPIGELAALPVCLAHACLSPFPAAERGAALVGSGALLAVRAVARAAGGGAGAIAVPPPTPAQIAAIAVTAAAAWVAAGRARLGVLASGAAVVLLLEGLAHRAGAPRGVLRVSVLDVAQGDAAVVDFPDGTAMLVDGGGFVGSPVDTGKRVLLPLLRARRRGRVDVAVLSHPHPDHFGGLASALPALEVGELWDTGQGEDQGAGPVYAGLLAGARSRGVTVRRPGELCGGTRDFGGATVEVLAPCPRYAPDAGANDNSLVMRIGLGRRHALLVGDAEAEAEAALLRERPGSLAADLLKVGHHGSRTSSTPGFLRAVSPSLAAISSGVRNRFGHPHPTTLATLAGLGIEVARTDRGGELVWETDGESVRVTRPAER